LLSELVQSGFPSDFSVWVYLQIEVNSSEMKQYVSIFHRNPDNSITILNKMRLPKIQLPAFQENQYIASEFFGV
jgi:hypothetical protein